MDSIAVLVDLEILHIDHEAEDLWLDPSADYIVDDDFVRLESGMLLDVRYRAQLFECQNTLDRGRLESLVLSRIVWLCDYSAQDPVVEEGELDIEHS